MEVTVVPLPISAVPYQNPSITADFCAPDFLYSVISNFVLTSINVQAPKRTVGTVTRQRARRSGVQIPAETRDTSLIQTCPDRHWGPPSLLFNGYRVPFRE